MSVPRIPQTTLLVAALVGIVVATFANTLANDYVWDDFDIIVDNPETHSLDNLAKVLFSADLVPPYYRPIPRATFLLEYAVAGANPAVSHAIGVMVHLAAATLLFLFARRLLRRDWPAFVAAVLWAVHPVAAEAVGFASVRTNSMAMFFLLGTLLAAWRAWTGGSRAWRAMSAVAYLVAMGCKEQGAMALPLFALLTHLSPRIGGPTPTRKTVAVALLPFVAALAVYLAARIHSLGGVFGAVPQVVGRGPAMGAGDMALAAGKYLLLLLWPAKLTVAHDLAAQSSALLLAGFVLVVGATLVTIRYPRPARVLGLGWFWLMLLPTLQVVTLPSAAIAERHAYFICPGIVIAIVDAVMAVTEHQPSRKLARAAMGLAGIATVALSARTIVRNRDWRDNRSLFASSLAVHPSALAHLNLGNDAMRRNDMQTAEAHWRSAVKLDPRDADALNQLGVLAAQTRRYDEAREYFTRALEAHPGHPVATANLNRLPASGRPRRQVPSP